jgi:hypothetical protein
LGIFRFLAEHRERLPTNGSEEINDAHTSIAGENASAAILGPQMKLVATDVTVADLKGTGHWLMEERPEDTMNAIVAFL